MEDPTPKPLPGGTTCYCFSEWHGLIHDNAILKHGFFTTKGGVSHGVYTSLNCGLGSLDDPERVRQNRARAASGLGFDAAQLVGLRQIHSAAVHVVDNTSPRSDTARPEADAHITGLQQYRPWHFNGRLCASAVCRAISGHSGCGPCRLARRR